MTLFAGALMAPTGMGCGAGGWEANADLLAPPREVAAALGDSLRPEEDLIDPTSIPVLDPPIHLRPCCQLGMDQRVKLGDVEVPGYKRGNILGIEEIGKHSYDSGLIPLTADEHGIDAESNGLLYTCRGGFIDVAHVRDYADWTFFIALRLSRALPGDATFSVQGDGAERRVRLHSVPEQLVLGRGRLSVAATLARWIVYQLSVWHEIASWYGVENVKGFSERGSTFSPEDLYSNMLGIKIGAALASESVPRTQEDYNLSIDAWLSAALRRLDVVPKGAGRAAMKSVDGIWWDSRKFLPDPTFVLRRNLDIGLKQTPWRIDEALSEAQIPRQTKELCDGSRPPLALVLPESVDGLRIDEIVTLEIEPLEWARTAGFPFPRPSETTLSPADFPKVVEDVRSQMKAMLGEDVDKRR